MSDDHQRGTQPLLLAFQDAESIADMLREIEETSGGFRDAGEMKETCDQMVQTTIVTFFLHCCGAVLPLS